MEGRQGSGVAFDNVLFLCCVGKALCVPTASTGLLGCCSNMKPQRSFHITPCSPLGLFA